MQRLRSTLVLLVAFLAIGGYAWFVERERPPASEADANEPAFDGLEADDITALTVTAATGDVTTLRRAAAGGTDWTVTAPVDAPADTNAAAGIASSLATLEIRRIVEEAAADLAPFGLDAPAVTVAFTVDGGGGDGGDGGSGDGGGGDSGDADGSGDGDADAGAGSGGAGSADGSSAGGASRTVAIGDETPTGGERYAVIDGTSRVILIPAFIEPTLNKSTFDLRDRSVLEFTGPDVTQFTVAQDGAALRFAKADGDWRIVDPLDVRADFGLVEAMVGRLGSGEMVAITEETADGDALAPFGLDAPRLTATVEVAGARHTLLVGDETEETTVYARDASRGLVFTIDASLVDDLARGADTYRQKNLFDFRPFNATALTVARGGRTVRFEKGPADAAGDAAGAGPDADEAEAADDAAGAAADPFGSEPDEVWRRVDPEPAEIERAAMDEVLRGLSNLRATAFVADRPGLDDPIATVTVTFGEGEEERVVIARPDDAAHAAHGDEPGAAVVDAAAVDEALEKIDAIDPAAGDAP